MFFRKHLENVELLKQTMLDEELLNSDDLASSSSDESDDQPTVNANNLDGVSQESDSKVNSTSDGKKCSKGKKNKSGKVKSFSCLSMSFLLMSCSKCSWSQ